MADFFYQIVKDAVNYDDTETQAELYALTLDDAKGYIETTLTENISNEFLRQAVMADLCDPDSDFLYEWWRYIQDTCYPDPDEEEAAGSPAADSTLEAQALSVHS